MVAPIDVFSTWSTMDAGLSIMARVVAEDGAALLARWRDLLATGGGAAGGRIKATEL